MEQPNFFFGGNNEDLVKIILEALTRFHGLQNLPYHSHQPDGSLKLYTRNEAAVVLKCSPNNVSKHIKSRRLHATYLNGVYRISELELIKFLSSKSSK